MITREPKTSDDFCYQTTESLEEELGLCECFFRGRAREARRWAVWKNGEQFLGVLQTPLGEILRDLKDEEQLYISQILAKWNSENSIAPGREGCKSPAKVTKSHVRPDIELEDE